MKTIKIDIKNPDIKVIKKAAEILHVGGIVVYPTDTSYGLGVNALDKKAVKKLYEFKGRNFSKPTHVVVRDWEMIEHLCLVNDAAKKLYGKFLPGPLTIILPKKNIVPDILTAGLNTVGVRIPDNSITQLLSESVSFPYTTPSANKSDGVTPYSIEDVKKELKTSKIDLILDAGKLPPTLPSTIVDLSTTQPKILREGPISKKNLEEFLI